MFEGDDKETSGEKKAGAAVVGGFILLFVLFAFSERDAPYCADCEPPPCDIPRGTPGSPC